MASLFVGNALWLDFLNTETAAPSGGGRREALQSPADLAAWAAQAGLRCEPGGQAWLEQGRSFRARLRTGAERFLDGGDATGLAGEVNRQLVAQPSVWRLVLDGGAGRVLVQPVQTGPDELFHRIALDCAETLASGRLATLKRCERNGCVVLFFDTSKNRGRRWCSMDLCGNREKASGRRARERETAGGMRSGAA